MRGSTPKGRSRRQRSDEGTDDSSGSQEKIVVHVHVHRDGKAGGEAEDDAGTSADAVTERGRRRPTLSGRLFDWRNHYLPVAKRHNEALTKHLGGWQGLASYIRQVRDRIGRGR
jgi:hypothetical protein